MRKASVFIACCLAVAFALALKGQSVEAELSPVMKEVAVRMESLRKGLNSKSAIDAANEAERLQALFIRAAGTFSATGAPKVANAARANVGLAAQITRAVNGGNFQAAEKSADALQKSCKACHDAHREQLPDKTYKFKK